MKPIQLLRTIPLVFCVFLFNGIYAQEGDEQKGKQPKTEINVQKEMDEEGNIIRMDSVYKWSWSGSFDTDSMMTEFEKYFDFSFPHDFTFDFKLPEIDVPDIRFQFNDSLWMHKDLDEFLRDFEASFQDFHIYVDPFEKWGGEEAFRKHIEENLKFEELEDNIRKHFDHEEFDKKIDEMMEKHREMLKKFENMKIPEDIEENLIDEYRHHHDREYKPI